MKNVKEKSTLLILRTGLFLFILFFLVFLSSCQIKDKFFNSNKEALANSLNSSAGLSDIVSNVTNSSTTKVMNKDVSESVDAVIEIEAKSSSEINENALFFFSVKFAWGSRKYFNLK